MSRAPIGRGGPTWHFVRWKTPEGVPVRVIYREGPPGFYQLCSDDEEERPLLECGSDRRVYRLGGGEVIEYLGWRLPPEIRRRAMTEE